MEVRTRLADLARIRGAGTPVVSVYLNTRWSDEQQRERVRVFLKNEIRRARARAGANQELHADLEWVQNQGESLIEQARFSEAHGAALFACRRLGLREVLPLRVPFENAFVVGDAPFLRPLATALDAMLSALVVFVDGRSARLIPLTAEGVGDEVTLESEVPGRHRQGGWALLTQSRYQRHIQEHRGRHFEAVAETLAHLTGAEGIERIVVAGEPRTVALFEKHLPRQIARRVVGRVAGARHESAGVLVARAAEVLGRRGEADAVAVDQVLTEAGKSGKAVAGIEETLDAVGRGAVRRLYLLKGFSQPGRACVECGSLLPGDGPACRFCGKATKAVELGEMLVDRVLAAGGEVETIASHPGLGGVGGVAALLRYPL